MGLCFDVYEQIKKDSELLHFTNIFGNLAQEQIVMAEIKSICSNVHNGFHKKVSPQMFVVHFHVTHL